MKHMTGKIIVLTGGSGGLGRELKEFYRASGNTVVDLSRSNPGEGDDLICDVADPEMVRAAFDFVKQRYGRVDILINNAGYGVSGAVELLEDEQVKRIFDVNFHGAFSCIKAALPLMSRGGRIVNVSSACAVFALPFRAMYCASKAALSMLSHSLREEVRPYGISVTAICPGDTKTGFTKNRVKNFATNERYGERIKRADDHIGDREERRMSPQAVAKKMCQIIAKRSYRPFYIVGKKYKFLYVLNRLLPLGWIIRATGGLFAPADKKQKK
jgi:NAD(P)-dependent dehydrogenase (short-subunit alcohol dehydrogenase family)